MTPCPKPAKRQPRPRRGIVRRAPVPRRRRTLGARRREAKALGEVDSCTWAEICWFYRDPEGSGRILCAYCEKHPATQQDHVVPLSRGGKHEPANVVPACAPCNYWKGTQTWEPTRRHPWMEAQDGGLL